jgi:aminocarboxymuconate-semialdehyde decarboxylase
MQRKIDIHTHMMPAKMPNWTQKFGYGNFIHLEHTGCKVCMYQGHQKFREVNPNCFDHKVRLDEMQEQAVDVQVLSTIPVLFNYWANAKDGAETSRFFNDHLAGIVTEAPQKFVALGTVPLQDIDLAIRELERCVLDLGMPGVEIGTNINGINLNDQRFHPFYEAADELGCSIFVHPWDMMGNDQLSQYWLPWLVGMPAETTRAICSLIFGGIFESFPKIRWCFAHGGGSFAYTLGRIQHGFEVRPDLVAIHNPLPPTHYLNKFWVDSLVHDPSALSLLTEKVGYEKICLGTDYPFPLGELSPGELIQNSIFSNELKESMLWYNALNWLNITDKQFI